MPMEEEIRKLELQIRAFNKVLADTTADLNQTILEWRQLTNEYFQNEQTSI